jgi:hypothetical protein
VAPAPPPEPAESASRAAVDERFTGKITAITFGCQIDASCNLVVDGTKYVDFGHDTRGEAPAEWGKADALWALKSTPSSGVGRTVEVFAATLDHESYTLRGKSTYYVHVLGR